MSVPLDPIGNIALSLQIVILFLLILGLLFVKGKDSKKNVTRHGYLTVLALVLHTALILVVMIPSFNIDFGAISKLSLLESIDLWSHVILGILAEVSGILLVGLWVFKSSSKMTYARRKKWMIPVFAIWTISLINGALVHIIGII